MKATAKLEEELEKELNQGDPILEKGIAILADNHPILSDEAANSGLVLQ